MQGPEGPAFYGQTISSLEEGMLLQDVADSVNSLFRTMNSPLNRAHQLSRVKR